MCEEERNIIWNKILLALDSSDVERVISFATRLSDLGDWRGSNTLAYMYENKAKKISETGNIDRENYIIAAEWYTKAISQGGGYAPHNGLATYYYYGLNGKYDFELAYKHLKYCIENESVNCDHNEALNQSVARNYIMMAELLFLGFGVPKDVDTARKLYCSAVEAGYPAALVGLSRIEKEAKRYRRAILYYFRALFQAAKLVVKNKDHPLLAGIGGKYHTFRRDWIG